MFEAGPLRAFVALAVPPDAARFADFRTGRRRGVGASPIPGPTATGRGRASRPCGAVGAPS